IEHFRAGVIRTRQPHQAMQSSTQDMAPAGRTLTEAGRQMRESTASRDRASLRQNAALALAQRPTGKTKDRNPRAHPI
ncbi:hypothetical protein, partial [Pseudomonas aeruginosa]